MENMTLLNQMAFWAFAGLMLLGATCVVFHKSIVYSALFLLLTFLSIAGVFVMLNAPFLAAAQILVYGVGLTIVMIFGIMLTGDKPFADPVGQEPPKRRWMIPAVVVMAFQGFLLWAVLQPNFNLTQTNLLFTMTRNDGIPSEQIAALFADGGIAHIGRLLFSSYVMPFELASVLLLLAMIGAIIISKRTLPEEEGDASVASQGPSLEEEFKASLAERGMSPDSSSEKQTLGVS